MIVVNAPSANYSLEEKQVGTWVDGKPLYQKTIVIEGLAEKGTGTFVGNTGLKDCTIRTVLGETIVNDGAVFQGTSANNGAGGLFYMYIVPDGRIFVRGSQTWVVNGLTLIVQYTKK